MPISRIIKTLPVEHQASPLFFVVLHDYSVLRASEVFRALESVSSSYTQCNYLNNALSGGAR